MLRAKLKTYYYIVSVLLIFICCVFILTYGWSFYATVTDRPGLNGNMHDYYQLSRAQFSLYDFIIVALSLLILIRLLFFTINGNKPKLTSSYLLFLGFSVMVFVAEIYLSSRFIGKG